jgi:hypothetical protein
MRTPAALSPHDAVTTVSRVTIPVISSDGGGYSYSGTGYANPDAVTQIATGYSTTTFQFDQDGNVTQKTVDGTTTTYLYDYANRLIALGTQGATTTFWEPPRMQAGMALAHLFAGRFESASSWAEKAYEDLPSFLMVVCVIAASHTLPADRISQSRQRNMCASSILRCAFPISRTGSRSADRNISRRLRRDCEGRGCLNEGQQGCHRARPISPPSHASALDV